MTPYNIDTVPAQLAGALATHHTLGAFVDADLALTYGELACCIERLQAYLPAHGAVAVFGKPSTSFAAATTACIVLGRAFVHLDPAMPNDVLANILSELHIDTVFVCQTPKNGQLPDANLVDVNAVIAAPNAAPDQPVVAAAVAPDDAIYIVATSGTTGKPKCIPVTQDAAYLSYMWRDAYTPYAAGQTVGSYIFAIWEMFRPLRDGARVCFPSFQQLLNPEDLCAFLIRYDVLEMLFTPSALEKILQASTAQMMENVPLKRVILNGEVVSDVLIAAAREKLPKAVLWNLYSICETHDIAMTNVSQTGGARTTGAVGVPMSHLRAIVLDDSDNECAVGQAGLLHFEGPRMLGPGYVNRAEETALRFRALTLNGRATRLYDTGDQGYVSADGTVHVLGRIAHMLKLRGHSIQTRELTESLQGHLGFLQAVPWIQDVAGQGNALVFYYCANPAQAAANLEKWGLALGENRMPAALSKVLRNELPAYCVPSYLVALDAIPINAVSGKCDFKSLPKINAVTPDENIEGVLPSVAQAALVLGCAQRDINSALSFHEHGGDSLMAVNLVLALEEAYGRRVDFDFALNVGLARLHEVLTQSLTAPVTKGGFTRAGILLTGVTGFLGSKVLTAAARNLPKDEVIYCLVRPKRRDPLERLHEIAAINGVDPTRLVLVSAAIEDARFGLGGDDYRALCAATRHVIHCAAMVNLAVDRDHMEIWSKAGISNIVQFCQDAKADLRFSSTSAVFPDTGGPYFEAETTLFETCGGYGAAKIGAEHLIAKSGINAAIVRLPSLYDIDAPNPNDIYETIMQACAETGAVPEGLTFRMINVHGAATFLADLTAGTGADYYNLMPNHLVTSAELPISVKVLPVDAWLVQASLSAGERALIAADLNVLHANSVFNHAAAEAMWSHISERPFASLSDPAALLARRFTLPK